MHLLLAAFIALTAVPALVGARAETPVTPVLPPALPWSGASDRLVAKATDPWATPAERNGFATTPRAAEVQAWLDRLAAASPLITVERFGLSGEGREMILIRASKGPGDKPVVLVQAGIHAGEIDGKDAGLMLLRDIALRGKADLLDTVDLVFVPIYNVDGHERLSRWNFPHLRGPEEKGTEGNARGLNLNRDYAKADAPETRAMIALLRRLDPILYVDCHVSGGFDMGYDITFTYAGWGRYARHRATADWLETRFGPTVTAALAKAGHIPAIYPSPVDVRAPEKGIRYSPEGPRYSTGYGDFVGVPTVLVENHMLKPYRQRVLGTYVLIEAALRLAGAEATRIEQAKASDRASRPTTLLTRWKPAAEPIGWVDDFKGVAFETYMSPASGRIEQRWLGKPTRFRMPIIGQTPVETVTLPKAWWVPAAQNDVIDRLRLHGIAFNVIAEPQRLMLDRVVLHDARLGKPSEGRIPLEARFEHRLEQETLAAGAVRVPSDQPLGLLAAALLEPESRDSFLAWGFFPEMLDAQPSTEDFVSAASAEALLARDPQLSKAFRAKLEGEPAFASDPEARLSWIIAQATGAPDGAPVYPIRREP